MARKITVTLQITGLFYPGQEKEAEEFIATYQEDKYFFRIDEEDFPDPVPDGYTLEYIEDYVWVVSDACEVKYAALPDKPREELTNALKELAGSGTPYMGEEILFWAANRWISGKIYFTCYRRRKEKERKKRFIRW